MNQATLREKFMRPRMGRRLLALAVSIFTMGVCVCAFRVIGFGTDPCSTFTLGVSARTGVSYGTCQFLFNLLLALVVVRFDISKIGVGTAANMLGVGYTADFFVYLFDRFRQGEPLSMASRLILLAVSMSVFLVAASFYINVDLGVAPYDGVPQILAARAKRLSPRGVRMLWDISILSVGFLLGSTVGLTTLLSGFCLGPAITAISKRVEKWFV